ncbi:nucleotidyltransferase domain-containing protein [Oceanirhabdus sp. W0125-5]|uniref:nucleotidyltransferase domain-containing protein n=1 Tax=Oceanirhabdus sp. W0125-5 TaxID=2999116 RepID=UPI0022F2A84D|nr:nucleotidyltransferase domain-containing protein [Oceanirhabdus sp. W0125-5]WBW99476.1 nucleotidyltransferase domain-containing protein [Oceanirhabdus sp. W0125-5]
MYKNIRNYQKAYNKVIEKLQKNENVLAAMVFGSMVTGDLWEESDIDYFAITNSKNNEIQDIHSKEQGIDIHVRFMSKSRFFELYEKKLEGVFIHRLMCTSKLVFSKDTEITEKYDLCRFIPLEYRGMWNMVFMGRLIKNLKECRKYLKKDNISTSFTIMVKCIEEYSKLYLSVNEYSISKNAVTIATNLNDTLYKLVKDLYVLEEDKKKALKDLVEYLNSEITKNLRDVCFILIEFLKEYKMPINSYELSKREPFSEYKMNLPEILDKLSELQIIKQSERDYEVEGITVFKEKVYSI